MQTATFASKPVIPAPIPEDEVARLAELHALELLDTRPSSRTLPYLELAVALSGRPLAAITLVDRHHEWPLAALGMPQEETPRDTGFHGHAIASDSRLMSIADSLDDPRVASGNLVKRPPHVRAYTGVVLRGPGGRPIGTLSVMDTAAGELDPACHASLISIADLIEDDFASATSETDMLAGMTGDKFDTLTGLAAPRLFKEKLAQSINWSSELGRRVAVVRVDIDRFRALNKAVGHVASDQVLQDVGRRLEKATPSDAFVARWQNDEFVVMAPSLTEKSDADGIVQSIADIFAVPFEIAGAVHRLSATIGASVYPDDGRSVTRLMDSALAALRQGKRSGGRVARVYTQSIDLAAARHFEIERRLSRALEREELRLVYQPKVHTRDGQISGMEALLRWDQPELGAITPAEFIPVAEHTGLIVDIGDWVLNDACRQVRAWQEHGLRQVPVSVNVAGRQLTARDFTAKVTSAVSRSGIDPAMLELEVTEGSLVQDTEATIETMHAIKALGVSFSIDDFGTGYSSLAYLKRLPISTLKVDRAFVMDMVRSTNDAAIVHAIIAMASSLGMRVVAEGVETREQWLFLRAFRCEQLQGFFFSRPVDPPTMAALLATDEPLGQSD